MTEMEYKNFVKCLPSLRNPDAETPQWVLIEDVEQLAETFVTKLPTNTKLR